MLCHKVMFVWFLSAVMLLKVVWADSCRGFCLFPYFCVSVSKVSLMQTSLFVHFCCVLARIVRLFLLSSKLSNFLFFSLSLVHLTFVPKFRHACGQDIVGLKFKNCLGLKCETTVGVWWSAPGIVTTLKEVKYVQLVFQTVLA